MIVTCSVKIFHIKKEKKRVLQGLIRRTRRFLLYAFIYNRFLDCRNHCFKRFDTRIVLAVGFHCDPWGKIRIRIAEHIVYRLRIKIPLVAVAPVLLCNLPLLFRGISRSSKTPELFVLIDCQPNLKMIAPQRCSIYSNSLISL